MATTPPSDETVVEPEDDFFGGGKEAFDFFNEEPSGEAPVEVVEPETKTELAPDKAGELEAAAPAVEPGTAPAAPVVEPAPAAPVVDPRDAEIAQMRETVRIQAEAIANAQRQQQPPAQPPSSANDPIFGITIPDELIAGMSNEDPIIRRNATAFLINGASDIVYRKVMEDVNKLITSHVPNQIQQHESVREQRDHVSRDFYGTYPEFDKPEFRTVVMAVANDVAREQGASSWTPSLRDAIGARLRRIASPATAQPSGQKPRATPRAVVPGTRPAPAGGKESITDFLGMDEV